MIVKSFKGAYEVFFTEDFIVQMTSIKKGTDVFIIDKNVHLLYQAKIDSVIGDNKALFIVPHENEKSYYAVGKIIDSLIQYGFRKNHRLVAIGGGITQDITAFIASILYRGVDWIFVPTNLLSQCDSCIGSKTSINFGAYKNQIGGFHPPKLIINDINFLKTLSKADVRSGVGEMMHYFFIEGENDFNDIASSYDRLITDLKVLDKFIRRSLEIKRKMIEVDEFDRGPRNIFNYGHSFGHAIESYTNYSLPHGIAVSFGMDLANHVSESLGLISTEEVTKLRDVLEKNWKPDILNINNTDAFISLLRKDKKNIDSDIQLVLTKGLGDMFLTTVEVNKKFIRVIESCFKYYSN